MEKSTGTACFIDMQSRVTAIVILEGFTIFKFISILSELEISFSFAFHAAYFRAASSTRQLP